MIELVLLIASLFSFPYIFSEAASEEQSIGFSMMAAFVDRLFSPIVPFASAQVTGCCAETTNGSACVLSTPNQCVGTFATGADCSTVNFCSLGCCYNEDEGLYYKNVLEAQCSDEWAKDPSCNLPGAALGCCVLGDTTQYETQGQCRVDSEIFALSEDDPVDWRAGMDEISCILLAGEQKVGACVFENNDCDFVTESDCISLHGEFNPNKLCTAPELETVCEMTEKTQCVDGKDGVYFVDSCDNLANIYDSTKAKDISYWTNYVKPEEACGAGSGNANSATCGNCNRFNGGICNSAKEDDFSVSMGEYYCRDTSCDYKGQTYKNGEAWCEYDGPINNGDDVPGSRHFRYICNAGEVQVEPCADYRNEICIEQNTLSTQAGSVTGSTQFSNAYCRKNNAKHCIEIGETSMAACRDEPDCMVLSVNKAGGSFDFDICVPQYPEGFSFEAEYQATGSQVCAINTRTCVTTYQKVLFGCVCIDNCGCPGKAHFGQMDDICNALGDCGTSSNWDDESWNGDVATYDPRVEKYMAAAGLTYDDYLGVGSALFEQSAFAGSLFAPDIDSSKNQVPTPEDQRQTISAVLSALGGLLAGLGGMLQNTLLTVAGLALTLFGALAGLFGGACPPKYTDYNCRLWEPPSGAANCEACNGDENRPCSAYRCHTLGSGCVFINQGTEDATCIAGQDDGQFPVVTSVLTIEEIIEAENLYDFPELLAAMQNVSFQDVTPNHIRITNNNGGCVDAYSYIPISFTTQKEAKCRFDLEEKEFADMQYDVGNPTYTKEHTTFFLLPDPSHGESQGFEVNSETEIYVKCQDRFGHEMPEYLLLEMCVNEGPDETPPRIVSTDPKDGGYIPFDAHNITFSVMTNELASCRWDYDSDTLYAAMTHDFICNDTWNNPSLPFGYLCSVTLPLNVTEGAKENTYYVRCGDQPWLEGTSQVGERNYNVQPFAYTFLRPDDMIKIDSVGPSGELITTADKLSVNLEVKTSDGAINHTCSYSLTGYDTMIEMYETGSAGLHVQPTVPLPANDYTAYFHCEDETGDFVRMESSFRIVQKSGGPQVSRAWQNFNNLNFITQEEADCRYTETNCNFAFDEAQVVSGDGFLHRIQAVKGKRYFIKCEDNYGNKPASCSIILSAV